MAWSWTGEGEQTANPHDVSSQVNDYAKLMEPQYQRSGASIANMMGGRGTLFGTPGSNKLQLLQASKLADIGKYGQGLMQTQEQRAYDQPFKMAELLGKTPGTTGQYQPGTGWTWQGGEQKTLPGYQTQYAGEQSQAMMNTATAEQIKGIASMIGSLPEAMRIPFAALIQQLMARNLNMG